MNPERLISLSIGIAAPGERVDGTPLKESDWTDVARALSRAAPEAADLLRGLYLHDERATRRVFGRLRAGYKAAGVPSKLAEEAARVTFGAFLAMRPCALCEGCGRLRLPTTEVLNLDSGNWEVRQEQWKDCPKCDGDGASHVSTSAARDALHVSEQVWGLLLAGAYDAAYLMLRRWHNEGMIAVMLVR